MRFKNNSIFLGKSETDGFSEKKEPHAEVNLLFAADGAVVFLRSRSHYHSTSSQNCNLKLSNSNNGVTHSSQSCFSLRLTSLLSFILFFLCWIFLWFSNCHFVWECSALWNGQCFCLCVLFCFRLSWYSVKLGKHLFVYI